MAIYEQGISGFPMLLIDAMFRIMNISNGSTGLMSWNGSSPALGRVNSSYCGRLHLVTTAEQLAAIAFFCVACLPEALALLGIYILYIHLARDP